MTPYILSNASSTSSTDPPSQLSNYQQEKKNTGNIFQNC